MHTSKRMTIAYLAMAAALLALFALNLFWGSIALSPADIAAALLGRRTNALAANILLQLRLPRAVMVVLLGAALSSLKGPKHGGANIKVMKMMDDIRAHVADPLDEEAMADYLGRIVDRQAFDQKGLIYGMGHAVYSLSDPRAVVFKSFVHQLADAKGRSRDFEYYNTIERLAPQVIAEKRHIYKGVSTNVDFYSGFVYDMLGIPVELYTPIFAVARIVGWSAHRMEELVNVDKIIRPAYQSIMQTREYVPLEER